MRVTITSRKATLRDSFKERVSRRLSKFERFFDDDAQAFVTVTMEGNRQTVELTIRNKGMIYRSEETTRNMQASFDAAADSLMRQITHNKRRLGKRLRPDAFEPETDGVSEEPEFEVVKVKRFPVKPMDVEEAILQMNLQDHEFFTFANEQTGSINVVYRRRDGGYGVLEPEID
mgnify:CR=1 FL=1